MQRPSPVLHEVRGAQHGQPAVQFVQLLLEVPGRGDVAAACGLVRANRRKRDDMRNGSVVRGSDETAVNLSGLGEHVASHVVRRIHEVGTRYAIECTRQAGRVGQIGDHDLGA